MGRVKGVPSVKYLSLLWNEIEFFVVNVVHIYVSYHVTQILSENLLWIKNSRPYLAFYFSTDSRFQLLFGCLGTYALSCFGFLS